MGMKVIGFVPEPAAAAKVVAWARALAGSDGEGQILCLDLEPTGRTSGAVRQVVGEFEDFTWPVMELRDPMAVSAVLDVVRKERADLLVSSEFALPEVDGVPQTSDELLRNSPCRAFLTLFGDKLPSEVERVLFVTTGGSHDRTGLRLVEEIRARQRAEVTLATIEDETGAAAGHAGERTIRTLLHDMALDADAFEIKVVVDRLRHRGILKCFEGQDLVIVGSDAARFVRPLRHSLGGATVSLVKRIPPLRLGGWAEWMPRINPADHAELIHDLRQGSRWGPDFVLMLGLASAVASLGLLQNSPAVVIGSMLLAPLMTPMMGLGLALGQANFRLMRTCGKSIGMGILLMLAVSYGIGLLTPTGETLTEELFNRGGPNILDLLIALFAANAAAFAMARPNISGAVAGVAIATALVPPGCTIGISLARGAAMNALGAGVLFFINLVAIIVASSLTFTALGVTAAGALPSARRRALVARVGLVALLFVLAGPLSTTLISQIESGKNVTLAYPVTRAVSKALQERVAQDEGVEIIFLARPRAENSVLIHLAATHELPRSYADELRRIVRQTMREPRLQVVVILVRGWWRSESDASVDTDVAP